MKLLHVPYPDRPESIIGAFRDEPNLIWLDSARPAHPQSCYSYILFQPAAVFEDITIAQQKQALKDAFDKDAFDPDAKARLDDLPPFKGGLAGYWSYEFGKRLELPFSIHEPPPYPSVMLGLYNQFYYYNHKDEQGGWVCWAKDEADAAEQKRCFEERITGPRKITEGAAVPEETWVSLPQEAEYKESVGKIRNAIKAGDIFQANLTRRLVAPVPETFDALSAYCRARIANPVPYGAFIRFSPLDILSFSPESFLSVTAQGDVVSRPIKGTSLPTEDVARSEKDRAENIMIVDLLRNDLSRLAEDKSVCVPSLCHTERFEGLVHLVSEIKARLKADVTALDALELCSPGGSITGAPKIEAMKIIDWLETTARGVYCGAIGYAGFDGSLETSIAIRTVVRTSDQLVLGVGGGITFASDPQAEYDETAVKSAPVIRGLR